MNNVENTPLEKRNMEEQIQTTLRLKRDARLDRMKKTRAGNTTLRIKQNREGIRMI